MKRTLSLPALACWWSLALGPSPAEARIDIIFPTPNTTWARGDITTFVQPTESGDPESGLFGCVRSGGTQFHEGLDVRPLGRDRRGEATDPIFAAMDGVVRHVSQAPGSSRYGRYLVLEHPEQRPAVYTLYAHLARIAPGLAPGVRVRQGQTLGTMGRSAGGYAIPKDRAHLHFEIGLRLADDFQGWYDRRRFGSRNVHGVWNGMNLTGVDPLDLLRQSRAGRVASFQQYFARLRPVVTVRVATPRVPDFVQRYPELLRRPIEGLVAGWEIAFNETALPFSWTPLAARDLVGFRSGEVRIVAADAAALRACRCRQLVKPRRGGDLPGDDLRGVLELTLGVPR